MTAAACGGIGQVSRKLRGRYGRGDSVARTSDILVHPRAHPILDRQSAGLGVLRIHRSQTRGAADAGSARHSIRSALDPAVPAIVAPGGTGAIALAAAG